jgi:hypothetical protein
MGQRALPTRAAVSWPARRQRCQRTSALAAGADAGPRAIDPRCACVLESGSCGGEGKAVRHKSSPDHRRQRLRQQRRAVDRGRGATRSEGQIIQAPAGAGNDRQR